MPIREIGGNGGGSGGGGGGGGGLDYVTCDNTISGDGVSSSTALSVVPRTYFYGTNTLGNSYGDETVLDSESFTDFTIVKRGDIVVDSVGTMAVVTSVTILNNGGSAVFTLMTILTTQPTFACITDKEGMWAWTGGDDYIGRMQFLDREDAREQPLAVTIKEEIDFLSSVEMQINSILGEAS
ncbi:hypothetical protein AGMMS49995_11030 [Endomicrobiia bacterium]|nr:hypothetical protein AGMMS49995_11030 [Endomicrobiia bacterium]